MKKFIAEQPEVRGAERWLKGIEDQNNALKRINSKTNDSTIEKISKSSKDLRVEFECASVWKGSLSEIRQEIKIGGRVATEFDFVIDCLGKDKERIVMYGDAKNTIPYTERSYNHKHILTQIDKQQEVIDHIGGGQLFYMFPNGVGADCAERYREKGVIVIGERVNESPKHKIA